MCVHLTDEHAVSPFAVASVLSGVINRVYVCVCLNDELDVSPSTVVSLPS